MAVFFADPRSRRLRRDYEEMLHLRSESTILDFEAKGDPPERYVLTFRGRGLGPRGRLVELHQVDVQLGTEYPRTAPLVAWRTPIYHPNISGGSVCFGNFSMTPFVRLTEIVEILWDMARMAVFNPHAGYGTAEEFYEAMRNIGGFPVDPRILRDKAPPPPGAPGEPEIILMGAGNGAWTRLAPEEIKSWVESYLRTHDLAHDAHVYTQKEWRERQEKYGNDAVVSIAAEGPLYRLLNYADWPGAAGELEDWRRFLESMGLWYELGYAWSVHLYPL